MNASRKASKKRRLYREQNGRCHWCGVRMDLTLRKQVTQWPTLATLEHLDDRFNPERGKHPFGTRRVVLACHQCNHDRGLQTQAARELAELHLRSGKERNDAMACKLQEALQGTRLAAVRS